MRLLAATGVFGLLCFAQTQDPESLWKAKRYDSANQAFRAAVKANPKDAALRVRWGRLLLERFNKGDAAKLFEEALEIQKDYPPAYVGLAWLLAEDFNPKAVTLAQQAVDLDPKLIEARELLAMMALEDNNFAKAEEEARKTLALEPKSLDSMAVLAGLDLLQDRVQTEWLSKMLSTNPTYGLGYARIARWFVLNRRYEEAIHYYRDALKLDPELHKAKSELGINLMRLGKEAEARTLLEEAFRAGNTDKPTANSLTLMDSYKNFVLHETDRAILKLHKREAAVLRPYVEREADRSIAAFEKKYEVKLPGRVLVEMYPDHEDFAVRTMGMPGLGALGVTFVHSIAMDSPSARKPGTFHWASTLWHEMSHVFALEVTNHRVPRWFTEGLAVHEETAASPEWGDRLTPDILVAMKEKKLLPVAGLDRGFIRPEYPAQVVVSYFQAGRICDYIQQRWGWGKLLEMLREFRTVQPTAKVIEKSLGMKPEEFDKEFLAWLEKSHATPLANFERWRKETPLLYKALDEKRYSDVVRDGAPLLEMYPEYVEAGSVYAALAKAQELSGAKDQAVRTLTDYAKNGGRDPGLLKKLSSLELERGNKQAAAAALERVLYVFPVKDEELHRSLGDLRAGAGDWAGAAEEYGSVIAGGTMDSATAHYNLARAYRALEKNDEAKEQLLLALETAPGYRPAQKMLLELSAQKPMKE
jgi:tetratricopeptide (TPR) repeat protein